MLSVDRSVKSRTSFGGTAPKNVRRAGQPMAQGAWQKDVAPMSRSGTCRRRATMSSAMRVAYIAHCGNLLWCRSMFGSTRVEFVVRTRSRSSGSPSIGALVAARRRWPAADARAALDPPPGRGGSRRSRPLPPGVPPPPSARPGRAAAAARNRCRGRTSPLDWLHRLSRTERPPCTTSPIATACCTPRRSISSISRTRSARRSIAIRPRR